MNIKNNQRTKDTDHKIIRTVYRKIAEEHKPVSKITVREICEEAEINRSTFYAHYLDVYDVVEKVESGMSERLTASILDKIGQSESVLDLFEEMFHFIKEHQEFYSIYFLDMHQTGVINFASEMLKDKDDMITYQKLGFRNQEEMEYAGAFFINGITALVRLWLNRGCKESPREMVMILARQFDERNQELFFGWNK